MTEVETFFETFRARFEAGDFDAVAALFNAPLSAPQISPQPAMSATEIAVVFKWIRMRHEAKGAKGYRLSVESEDWSDPDHCTAIVQWLAVDADGVPQGGYRASYAIRRAEDGALIINTLNWHDETACTAQAGRVTHASVA